MPQTPKGFIQQQELIHVLCWIKFKSAVMISDADAISQINIVQYSYKLFIFV